MKRLIDVDPEIAEVIRLETERQATKLELIASESCVSEAVLAAMGSPLTNKYAEGYPGKRYYGGCEFVDTAETLAIERSKPLFGADHRLHRRGAGGRRGRRPAGARGGQGAGAVHRLPAVPGPAAAMIGDRVRPIR